LGESSENGGRPKYFYKYVLVGWGRLTQNFDSEKRSVAEGGQHPAIREKIY